MNNNGIAPNIIDNSPGRELIQVIKDQLKKSNGAKFAIGYFFLSGFCLVKDDFPDNLSNINLNIPFLKIVMSNETTYPTKEELVAGYNLRELFKQRMIEDLQRQELTEGQIRRLKALRDFVANNIIDVKLFDKSRLHAKQYLFLTKPEERMEKMGEECLETIKEVVESIKSDREIMELIERIKEHEWVRVVEGG